MTQHISTLSVIVPVYNEERTVLKILAAVEAVPLAKEIIVVDDGSSDGTRELLRLYIENKPNFLVIYHEKNGGKGQAIRTGIMAVSGDAVIIQDADLEYDPQDFLKLVEAMESTGVQAVFGSRFLKGDKVTSAWHRFVNFFLTFLTNVLFSVKLTDMETCYKLFRSDFLKQFPLQSEGFEIEVELTARTLRSGARIVEIPISYKGRSFHEGKKIGWKDGIKALGALFKYRCAHL